MNGLVSLALALHGALEVAEMRIEATNDISHSAGLSCCSAIRLDS